MNQKQECPAPAATGNRATSKNVKHFHNTPLKGCCQIALQLLVDHHPTGIRSNLLRRECRTMNIAHQVRKLRLLNLSIHCDREEYRDEFGENGSIDRYRLDPESHELACRLLEAE